MFRLSSFLALILLFLAACASNQDRRGERGEGPGGPRQGGAGGGFAMAARMVDRGEYEAALVGLRCIASQGQGFEIAQYLAGYSALRLAEAGDTPDILRDEMKVEGFDRLTDAAEAGWPAAQAALAAEFAAVPGEDALAEAAYWTEVYRRNSRESVYGIDRLDDGIEADIAARLAPDRYAAAEARAANFTVSLMERSEAGPDCVPWLRWTRGEGMPRMGGPGGRRGEGRPPGGGGGGRPGGGL